MKDGPISKPKIIKTGHRPTQFKNITDAIPVLCTDKNFQRLDEVLWTGRDLVKTDFMPTYSNATQWSTTHHVQVSTVNPLDVPAANGSRPVYFKIMEQTHVFDANLQKELLSEYECDSKNKPQEYAKFLADKKALITILFGQCDEAIKTKITPGATYSADRQAGRLVAFIKKIPTVCFGSDDGGLSHGSYKQVSAIKSMNNYTNNEPYDPHSFKEQIKIKYKATKVIAGKFPNETAALMKLLSNAQPAALDWAGYCALPEADQLVQEQRTNALNQSIFYLMNSKNKNAKKNLRLAYSQGNNTTYPSDIESMARYLSTQYPNNKPANQRGGQKGDKRKGDDSKSEDKNSNTGGTAGAHVEDTTTNEDPTAPSGGSSLGAHVSETNQKPSRPSRTVDEILRAHTVNDDFWSNTNPTDVSINTANSEEMITGSHVTEFHAHKHEELVTTELLIKVLNAPGAARKHNIGQEHHNRSGTQSTTYADCKLATCKDKSFSFDAVKMETLQKLWGTPLTW